MRDLSRTITLTNTALKAVLPGETLWDEKVRGLHVRAKPGGTAYFLYYRTKAGRQRRPKLGSVTVLKLEQARENATAILAIVAAGGDPMLDRELVADSPTVDALFERVFKSHWKGKKTAAAIRSRYEKHVQGKRLGKLRVRETSYDDIVKVHKALEDTPYQANRVLTDLSKMFNYAERPLKWRDRHTNPCSGVVHYPEKKRKKFFKAEHLQRLIPILDRYAADEHGHPRIRANRRRAAAFLRVQLYSGARPEEPEVITPEMIETHMNGEEHGIARLPDAKTGQRDIYLPPQAMRALRSLPWVKGRPILGRFPRRLWRKIRTEAGCADLWARDTRRTFGTAVTSTSHGALTGLLLGQKSAQTTKIYQALVEDSGHDAAAAGATRIDQLARHT